MPKKARGLPLGWLVIYTIGSIHCEQNNSHCYKLLCSLHSLQFAASSLPYVSSLVLASSLPYVSSLALASSLPYVSSLVLGSSLPYVSSLVLGSSLPYVSSLALGSSLCTRVCIHTHTYISLCSLCGIYPLKLTCIICQSNTIRSRHVITQSGPLPEHLSTPHQHTPAGEDTPAGEVELTFTYGLASSASSSPSSSVLQGANAFSCRRDGAGRELHCLPLFTNTILPDNILRLQILSPKWTYQVL